MLFTGRLPSRSLVRICTVTNQIWLAFLSVFQRPRRLKCVRRWENTGEVYFYRPRREGNVCPSTAEGGGGGRVCVDGAVHSHLTRPLTRSVCILLECILVIFGPRVKVVRLEEITKVLQFLGPTTYIWYVSTFEWFESKCRSVFKIWHANTRWLETQHILFMQYYLLDQTSIKV